VDVFVHFFNLHLIFLRLRMIIINAGSNSFERSLFFTFNLSPSVHDYYMKVK